VSGLSRSRGAAGLARPAGPECTAAAHAARGASPLPGMTSPGPPSHHPRNAFQALKDAVEMAVLSSVQHPNIVQMYACLTDMVEVQPGARRAGARAACKACPAPRARQSVMDGAPGPR
jgi:hypothetical protein